MFVETSIPNGKLYKERDWTVPRLDPFRWPLEVPGGFVHLVVYSLKGRTFGFVRISLAGGEVGAGGAPVPWCFSWVSSGRRRGV